jgi:fucokinase
MDSAPSIRQAAFAAYQRHLAVESSAWWDAVILTAGSAAQATYFRQQIRYRSAGGRVPPSAAWVVLSDPENRPAGTGGATLLALDALARTDPGWWMRHRVLVIHAGGRSRSLPEHNLTGKLFGVLPQLTPWNENSTVFDEMLAMSSLWLPRFTSGLVVASGDVVLCFDPAALDWEQAGVCGAAIPQPLEVGARHGVYVLDDRGLVYSYLQKPAAADVRAAGGFLPPPPAGFVAVDTGLLHFDAPLAAALSSLAARLPEVPYLELYQHVTLALTGEAPCPLAELAELLRGAAFRCSLVQGAFTHLGATAHFRKLFSGGLVDSVLAPGSELGPGALAIECHTTRPVRAGARSILHGVTDEAGAVSIPADTVLHQMPVRLPDGRRGFVLRTYGVEDDPQTANWFGRPILEALPALGLTAADVWPGVPVQERSLWNARLFRLNNAEEPRFSLATSTDLADPDALAEARNLRRDANWLASALELARAGSDVRPLLIHAPGRDALAATGRALAGDGAAFDAAAPSEAASRHFHASLFFDSADQPDSAAESRAAAFHAVQQAVAARELPDFASHAPLVLCAPIAVSAPARIDFGGGWSDTPPFCIDWGGAVFNMAVTIDGGYPIRSVVSRLHEPVIRLVAADAVETLEAGALAVSPAVGSPFAIHRAALAMLGFLDPARPTLGLEIRTEVNLPMGSGLGTSSILAATVLKALLAARGQDIAVQDLSDMVLALEQFMTTGGGWQDQVGGVYPGAKLTMTGPGPRQRLRVEPVACPDAFSRRFVLYYTGIKRIAKNLLEQVVGRYLAREVQAVQVLHSIKTLAVEMAYAMRESDWEYLGGLLDRHWRLNQLLDPHTTNAPINALLDEVRPFISGAKLAGAGGGGYLMLLARSPEDADALRARLAARKGPGALAVWAPAPLGLHESGSPEV